MIYDKMKSRRGKNGLNFFEVIHDFRKGLLGDFEKIMWILQIITNLFIIFVQEDLKQIDKKQTNEHLHEHICSNYHSGWKGVQDNWCWKNHTSNIIQLKRYKICIKTVLKIWKSVWPKPRTTQDRQGL